MSADSQEMKVLLKMIKMWTNFAKTGYVHFVWRLEERERGREEAIFEFEMTTSLASS
jgi:hypothetical protein